MMSGNFEVDDKWQPRLMPIEKGDKNKNDRIAFLESVSIHCMEQRPFALEFSYMEASCKSIKLSVFENQ